MHNRECVREKPRRAYMRTRAEPGNRRAIWARTPWKVTKLLVTDRPIRSLTVDPHWETADVDVHNNHFPRRIHESRLEAFKREPSRDLMREVQSKDEDDDEKD